MQPVPNGGIPPHLQGVELRLTFKDGGTFDWHARYCEVRERLAQVRENAVAGSGVGAGGGGDVSLEQLPAYEAVDPRPAPTERQGVRTAREEDVVSTAITAVAPVTPVAPAPSATSAPPPAPGPDELPPGYEESQTQQRDEVVGSLGRMDVNGR